MNQYMKGVLCTIIGGACWGISGTCGEYLCTYRGMDTRVLTDMRLLGAGIILCIFLACRERKKLQEFLHTPKALIHCIIFGVCGLMFTQFAYLTAISKTNAGTATVLQYLSAIIVLLVVCVKNRKLPVLRAINDKIHKIRNTNFACRLNDKIKNTSGMMIIPANPILIIFG